MRYKSAAGRRHAGGEITVPYGASGCRQRLDAIEGPELSESHVFFAIFEAHAGFSTLAMAVRRFESVVVDSPLIGLA